MTLYLKYRPQKIADLDLKIVREKLTKIASSKDLPHAFLFAGQKGTGKTSGARILAKIVNCQNRKAIEPCNKCEQCTAITKGANIDVIEMDAASNRGIDDVRILRENVKLSPLAAAKKVYIIDEAHMLTNEAANALLKTLEEPPAHAIFILATTNPEKLPPTIHSRLTTINFARASRSEILQSLKRVADGEKMKVEEGALELLVDESDGSFRDAVKLLEDLHLRFTELTIATVREALFAGFSFEKFVSTLSTKDQKAILAEIEKFIENGISAKVLTGLIIKGLHKDLLEGGKLNQEETISLLDELLQMSTLPSPVPQLPLEIAISAWVKKWGVEKKIQETAREEKIEANLGPGEPLDEGLWKKILAAASKNASLETLLRASKPVSFDGKNFAIGVYYEFHKERLERATVRTALEELIGDVCGRRIVITCQLHPKPQMPVRRNENVLTEPREQDIIKAAKEIFES